MAAAVCHSSKSLGAPVSPSSKSNGASVLPLTKSMGTPVCPSPESQDIHDSEQVGPHRNDPAEESVQDDDIVIVGEVPPDVVFVDEEPADVVVLNEVAAVRPKVPEKSTEIQNEDVVIDEQPPKLPPAKSTREKSDHTKDSKKSEEVSPAKVPPQQILTPESPSPSKKGTRASPHNPLPWDSILLPPEDLDENNLSARPNFAEAHSTFRAHVRAHEVMEEWWKTEMSSSPFPNQRGGDLGSPITSNKPTPQISPQGGSLTSSNTPTQYPDNVRPTSKRRASLPSPKSASNPKVPKHQKKSRLSSSAKKHDYLQLPSDENDSKVLSITELKRVVSKQKPTDNFCERLQNNHLPDEQPAEQSPKDMLLSGQSSRDMLPGGQSAKDMLPGGQSSNDVFPCESSFVDMLSDRHSNKDILPVGQSTKDKLHNGRYAMDRLPAGRYAMLPDGQSQNEHLQNNQLPSENPLNGGRSMANSLPVSNSIPASNSLPGSNPNNPPLPGKNPQNLPHHPLHDNNGQQPSNMTPSHLGGLPHYNCPDYTTNYQLSGHRPVHYPPEGGQMLYFSATYPLAGAPPPNFPYFRLFSGIRPRSYPFPGQRPQSLPHHYMVTGIRPSNPQIPGRDLRNLPPNYPLTGQRPPNYPLVGQRPPNYPLAGQRPHNVVLQGQQPPHLPQDYHLQGQRPQDYPLAGQRPQNVPLQGQNYPLEGQHTQEYQSQGQLPQSHQLTGENHQNPPLSDFEMKLEKVKNVDCPSGDNTCDTTPLVITNVTSLTDSSAISDETDAMDTKNVIIIGGDLMHDELNETNRMDTSEIDHTRNGDRNQDEGGSGFNADFNVDDDDTNMMHVIDIGGDTAESLNHFDHANVAETKERVHILTDNINIPKDHFSVSECTDLIHIDINSTVDRNKNGAKPANANRVLNTAKENLDKLFKCFVCERNFATKSGVLSHLRTHSKD